MLCFNKELKIQKYSQLILLVCLFLIVVHSAWGKTELQWSSKIRSKIKLKTGLIVSYDYHFDRNAIKSSVYYSGDFLLALTDANILYQFDIPSF